LHAAYNGLVTAYYNWLISQPEVASEFGVGYVGVGAALAAAIIGGLLLLKSLTGGQRQSV
jgi:hypothetical protein